MSGLAAISKKKPRGRPFPKGVSGNPSGRPKRTEEEVQLAEACRARTRDSLGVILGLMQDSSNDRVRLAAAQFIIERGWGRAPEKIEAVGTRKEGPLPGEELSPAEAYMRVVRGGEIEEVISDAPQLPHSQDFDAGVDAVFSRFQHGAER